MRVLKLPVAAEGIIFESAPARGFSARTGHGLVAQTRRQDGNRERPVWASDRGSGRWQARRRGDSDHRRDGLGRFFVTAPGQDCGGFCRRRSGQDAKRGDRAAGEPVVVAGAYSVLNDEKEAT